MTARDEATPLWSRPPAELAAHLRREHAPTGVATGHRDEVVLA